MVVNGVGTAIAHEELFNLIVLTYKQPEMAPLFNAASSAWNNAFFFTGIVLSPLFEKWLNVGSILNHAASQSP